MPRAREVLGLLRTVLFAPEDLALVRGDPSERRRFLDDLLVLRAPRLAGVRADYERVLKQRNALLKTAFLARRSGGGDMRTLDVWDAHLARTGAELLAARLALVDGLSPHVAKAYAEVSAGQGETGLAYRSSLGDALPATQDREVLEAALLSELARVRPQEVERGVSLVGPHRDELVAVAWATCPSRATPPTGSRGRSRSRCGWPATSCCGATPPRATASRCSSWTTCSPSSTPAGATRLAELVGGAEQVLVTAAVPDDVPEALLGGRYDVHGGTVTRVR